MVAAPAALLDALGEFPEPDYSRLCNAAHYWASFAAIRTDQGLPPPWLPVPVIPHPVPAEFVSTAPGRPALGLDHKQPCQWVQSRETGEIQGQAIRWVQKWPRDPRQVAARTVQAIQFAQLHALPIGIGMAITAEGGALCLDADVKDFHGGREEMDQAMAQAVSWAQQHGLFVERSGSGGLHLLGLASSAPQGDPLGGKFDAGAADRIRALREHPSTGALEPVMCAGEVRGDGSNGFIVTAPTYITGKPDPYGVEHFLQPELWGHGVHWPDDWADIGIRPAASVTRSRSAASSGTSRRTSSSSSDWPAYGPGDPCPICGRDTTGACTHTPDGNFVTCHHGSTFAPPMPAQGWVKNATIIGACGTTWAFIRHYEPGGGLNTKSLFRRHDPTRKAEAPPPPPPQPEAELIDATAGGTVEQNIAACILAARTDNAGTAPLLHLTDVPGLGKSHKVEQIARALLASADLQMVVYCAADYRSPSVPELKRWATVTPRHGGLEVVDVNGTQKIRRRKPNSTGKTISGPSCLLAHQLNAMRAAGLSNAQESTICRNCLHRPGCSYVEDHQRLLADLRHNRIRKLRCSVQSLPALASWVGEEQWRHVVVIVDELPPIISSLSTVYELSWADLERWQQFILNPPIGHQRYENADQLALVIAELLGLKHRLKKIDDQAGHGSRFQLYGLDAIHLWEQLTPLRSRLQGNGINPTWLEDIEIPEVDTGNGTVSEPLLLPALLRALLGTPGHALRCTPTGLSLRLAAGDELTQALASAHSTLVLDGTARPTEVAAACRPDGAYSVIPLTTDRRTGLEHLTITQLTGGGNFSPSRPPAGSENAHRNRIVETLQARHKQLGVMEHTKHLRKGWGAWFSSSRGTNAFATCDALLLVGMPNINLADGLSQYMVINRITPGSFELTCGFDLWYARRREEELMQAIHRLRPVRRADEHLIVYVLTDVQPWLEGASIKQQPCHELSWYAGDKHWYRLHEVRDVCRRLIAADNTTSMRAVATALAPLWSAEEKGGRNVSADGAFCRIKRSLDACRMTWELLLKAASIPA